MCYELVEDFGDDSSEEKLEIDEKDEKFHRNPLAVNQFLGLYGYSGLLKYLSELPPKPYLQVFSPPPELS